MLTATGVLLGGLVLLRITPARLIAWEGVRLAARLALARGIAGLFR